MRQHHNIYLKSDLITRCTLYNIQKYISREGKEKLCGTGKLWYLSMIGGRPDRICIKTDIYSVVRLDHKVFHWNPLAGSGDLSIESVVSVVSVACCLPNIQIYIDDLIFGPSRLKETDAYMNGGCGLVEN